MAYNTIFSWMRTTQTTFIRIVWPLRRWSQRNVTIIIFPIHIYLLPSLQLKLEVNAYGFDGFALEPGRFTGYVFIEATLSPSPHHNLILFDLLRRIQVRIAFFSEPYFILTVFGYMIFFRCRFGRLGANIFIVTKRHSIDGSGATRESCLLLGLCSGVIFIRLLMT